MDSALIITSMDNPLQHLRTVRAEDLTPDQQQCNVCRTPWCYRKNRDTPFEYPVILPCGCIAGSFCLEQAFEKSPRCPLCHTTIRIIPGVNAPLNPGTYSHLRQLELSSGLDDWPIPSIESRPESPNGECTEESEQLEDKLGVLNGCHGTFLSLRELEICISLIDYRLGTATSTIEVLDAFIKRPLFDPSRWERTADIRAYMEGRARLPFRDDIRVGDLRDVLVLLNMRAGTSFLLDELELVVSLMNHIHGMGVGLLDVLGLRDGRADGRVDFSEGQVVDRELVRAFGTLDVRVGGRNAVEDLEDVLSQAAL